MSNREFNDRYNHNYNYCNDGVVHIHITDFLLTGRNGELQPLLVDSSDNDEPFRLKGTLICPTSSNGSETKVQKEFVVNSYVVDWGRGGPQNAGMGFWMTGEDPDIRIQLVYPAAPEYQEFARGILDLAADRSLLRYYLHMFESQQYLQWTDFSLIDCDLGTSRNLLLSTHMRSLSLLKGTIKLNPSIYCANGMPEVSDASDVYNLKVQTYLVANYFVDFGKDASGKDPEFWVEDCHLTWIKLLAPCHVDYRADFELTMNQTVRNVQGYNWAAEDEQIWRHVTNFRLTDLTGAPHALEITALNAHFILWGDLVPPAHSTCPVIPIKLYVTTFSLDLGRDGDDPNQGVWMGDVRGDWYKLVAPAHPDFRTIADPLLHKADKFLQLYDALVYQDVEEKISVYDDALEQYRCQWDIRDVHKRAQPKFDLDFVRENADFVLTHLETNFHLASSLQLVNSIVSLKVEVRGSNKTSAAATPAASNSRADTSLGDQPSSGTQSGQKRAAPSTVEQESSQKVQKMNNASIPTFASAAAVGTTGKGSASGGTASSSSTAASGSSAVTKTGAGSPATTKPTAAASKAASQPAPPVAASKPIKKKQLELIDTSSPILSAGRKTPGTELSAVTPAEAPPARSVLSAATPTVVAPASAPAPVSNLRGAAADTSPRAADSARWTVAGSDMRGEPAPYRACDVPRVDERRIQEQIPGADGAYELCRYCKQLRKKDSCRNERHKDGKDVWYYFTTRNPGPVVRQNSGDGGSTPRGERDRPDPRLAAREPSAELPATTRAPAGLTAAPAGKAMPAPASEAPIATQPQSSAAALPEHIRTAQEALDRAAAANRANRAKFAMKDDLMAEHAKYDKRSKSAGDDYLSSLFSTGPKAGGHAFALPGAAARLLSGKQPATPTAAPTAPGVAGLVKLGGRMDNPAQRMAQTTRTAPGVFADSSVPFPTTPRVEDFFAWGTYRHDPAMKAPKSALKRSTMALVASTAVVAAKATRLRWNDCEGGFLQRTRVYERDEIEKLVYPTEVNRCENKDDEGEE